MKIEKTSILEMNRLSPEEYHSSPKVPLIVVLDDVRSLHNVGSVFRTADAFRLEEIYLCGITGRPPHPLIHKTALGAEDVVPWSFFPSVSEALERLRSTGRQIFALEQTHQSVLLGEQPPIDSRGVALVVGNEVHGVSNAALDLVDCCIEIPQYGTKHSLNVSVATGIAIYQIISPAISSGKFAE